MKNQQINSLIVPEKLGFFSKIRNFLKKIFFKEKIDERTKINSELIKSKYEEKQESFIDIIKNQDTELLKLQESYRNGEVTEEEMTEAQISALAALYDRQIAALRADSEYKKQKIIRYREKVARRDFR